MTSAVDTSVRHSTVNREEKLLTTFFVLYKTARILEDNNAALHNQVNAFLDAMHMIPEDGDITIKAVRDRYFVNNRLVRFDDRGQSGAAGVVAEWHQLGVGGVTFATDISNADIRSFVRFMASEKPNASNIDALISQFKSLGLPSVTLLSLNEVAGPEQSTLSEEDRKRFRQMARTTFFQAMNVVQEAVIGATYDKEINIGKTKRVVQSLIDHITQDESSLIELTSIKNFDDYTFAHSTNVCIYSLTLGVRLGLDRARLSQLGFTALFHDIGKVKLPTDLIRKPDAFDENDWIQMQRHPLMGAKTILRNQKLDPHTARAARGAFEHHINSDFTGYPSLRHNKRPTNLFSRIISVVDTFDALTAGRVYHKKAIPPDVVISKMRYQMKAKFDPFLLKIFNEIVGVYPAGTMVLLATEEIGLVLTNNESNMARPYVKIVGNRDGLLAEPIWCDLSTAENVDRKILRGIDPARYGLDIKAFVLAD